MSKNQQPSTSSSAECEIQNVEDITDIDGNMSEESKQELADAIQIFVNLFREHGFALPAVSASISERSRSIGNELYEWFWIIYGEMTFTEVEEVVYETETDDSPHFVDMTNIDDHSLSHSSTSPAKSERGDEDSAYEPESKKLWSWEQLPLDVRITAVTLAKQHLTWSSNTLQMKGATPRLMRKDLLKR